MRKTFLSLLIAATAIGADAQTTKFPTGAYEGTDKVEGVSRWCYMEINLTEKEPTVPDFSQTFTKGQEYDFMLLPNDFQKKPSPYFKGQKAYGFVKYRSKYLLTNNEVCKLTNPRQAAGALQLDWENEFGKKGTCTLYAPTDSTIYFIGLGTFKELGPDKLILMRSQKATARKPYLKPASQTPAATPTPTAPTGSMPVPPAKIKIPATNTANINGIWTGCNSDGSKITVKLNSKTKSIDYYGSRYYGLIEMDGPAYIKEGVVGLQKLSGTRTAIYTVPLDTDNNEPHYSVADLLADGSLIFYNTSATPATNQMGRHVKIDSRIVCTKGNSCFSGTFSTGKETKPFQLDLYHKGYHYNGFDSNVECYGVIHTSKNMGGYTDHDVITEVEILSGTKARITYKCGRTDETHKAVLTFNPQTKAFTAQKLGGDDTSDCMLYGVKIEYVCEKKY